MRFLALFGTGALPTALAFGVLELDGASPAALGMVMAVATLGQVVTFVPGGVAADRWSRRHVLVLSQAVTAAALLTLGVAYVADAATVAAMAVLAGAAGMAAGFFFPAATGLVPEVCAPKELHSTNAVLRMSSNLARVGGAALGGMTVALFGAGWAIIMCGLLPLAATMVLLRLKPRFTVPRAVSSRPLSDLSAGWQEFIGHRWLVSIVGLGAASSFGAVAFFGVLGPLRMEESGGAAGWALITTALSVGLVVGAAASFRIRPRRPLLVAVIALSFYSMPMFALAASAPLAVTVAAAFVAGTALDIWSVLWDTTVQRRIPRELLSRVSSFDWLGNYALSPIALAVAGPLVVALGLSGILWAAAILTALALLALLEPQVRAYVVRSR